MRITRKIDYEELEACASLPFSSFLSLSASSLYKPFASMYLTAVSALLPSVDQNHGLT